MKEKYPDAILLFRVGEFYEVVDEDARVVSALTGARINTSTTSEFKECTSIHFYSLDSVLHKLVKAGHRVAVCDGLEDPKKKKQVKRGVTDLLQSKKS